MISTRPPGAAGAVRTSLDTSLPTAVARPQMRTSTPSETGGNRPRQGVPTTPFGWGLWLWKHRRDDFESSPREVAHGRPWPKEARTDAHRAPVFANNELFIPGVAPKKVFAALTDVKRWPAFYENASRVHFDGDRLGPGSRFRFTTFGVEQKSQIVDFEQDRALAWTADSLGTHATHRWILEPHAGGTRVITEEVQTGLLAHLDAPLMNPALHATHQLWLERLAEASSASPA